MKNTNKRLYPHQNIWSKPTRPLQMMDFLARPPLLRGRGSHEKIGASHEKGSYEESSVEGGFDDSLNYSEDNIEGGDNMAMFQVY